MGLETDAFDRLDQELEEELKQRNFHLAKDLESLMFERKLIPHPSWLFVSMVFNLISLLILIYLLSYFSFEIISIMKKHLTDYSFERYEKYIKLGISFLSLVVALKTFLRRIVDKLYSFFYLSFTDYIITNNYIYLRSRAGSQRGRMIPLSSISSIVTRQSLFERFFGVGDIVIHLKTGQNFYIHSIKNHEEIAKDLMLLIQKGEGK